MSEWIGRPYEGNEPYLFISYSRKDADVVYPILQFLQENRFRLWYDSGIDPGAEWPEVIAEHLDRSRIFLAFLSSHALASQSCRREFNFAIMNNMPTLSIFLEEVELTPVLKMQMASVQMIPYYECAAPAIFQEKLLRMPELYVCQEDGKTVPMERQRKEPAIQQMLYFLHRKRTGEKILISHNNFRIGRRYDLCDFAVAGNMTVSKVHAIFDLSAGVCRVKDNQSTNHIYVNNRMCPAEGWTELHSGDLIELGSEQFVLEIQDPEDITEIYE